MKQIVSVLIVGVALMMAPAPGLVEATSFRPIPFEEMVGQAAVIVRGRVLEMRTFVRGGGVARNTAGKSAEPPVADRATSQGAPQAPQSAATRGGSMIFTHVVLQSSDPINGAGASVEFDIAGGTHQGRTAWVPGMPKFDQGGEYVLFLRQGYESAADPVLGVRQGFFRVVANGASRNVVLNADFDYVIGIESGRVVARHNPGRGQLIGREMPSVQVAPPPVAATGAAATRSPESQRYFSSSEAPLTVDSFVAAIRSRLNR